MVAIAFLGLSGCAAPSVAPAPEPIVRMPIQARVVSALDDGTSVWNLQEIHKNAFHLQSTSGERTVVAVLDTGVDPHQPDLQGRLDPLVDMIGSDRLLTGGRTISYDGIDGNGHGTHVAGIIAAVSAGTDVRILPIKVIPNSGVGDDVALSQGIERAIAWRDPADPSARVRVLNLSVSSAQPSDRLRRAIDDAIAAGLLVVAAAGNDAGPIEFPASMPQVLSVGAADSTGQVADYSCFGDGLDVTAPGGSDDEPVYSDWPTYLTSSDYHDGVTAPHDTAGLVGTSMAAPHVSGTAAVLWTLHPNLTAQQVRAEVLGMADDMGTIGPDAHYGYGLLDFQRAFLGDQHDAH
ncbi:MAG TPA: S8 family serine peptidase [Oscillatoriaceae cyanobacterium]